MSKAKAVAVGVPWMITPSTPFLKFFPPKADGTARVTFVGFFGLEETREGKQLPSEEVPAMVEDPGDFRLEAGGSPGPYRMIRITFSGVKEAECQPNYDDERMDKLYDWSSCYPESHDGQSLKDEQREFWGQWRTTGLCPDPGIFEILESPRLKAFKEAHPVASPLRHYVIRAHDDELDIIAEKWVYEEGQTLLGW